MEDEIVLAETKTIKLSKMLNEVSITFICATEEEANLTYAAVEAELYKPYEHYFKIKIKLGPSKKPSGSYTNQ